MHTYDYRCKNCQQKFSLHYKSYQERDASTPCCPHCNSTDLSRLIGKVAVQRPSRDYSKMSSQEMLSVFESGDSRQVGEMFQQVGGGAPELGAQYHETTQRLLKGENINKVERDLSASGE